MENVPNIVKKVKYIAEEYILTDFEAKQLEEKERDEELAEREQEKVIQTKYDDEDGSMGVSFKKKTNTISIGTGDSGPFDL